jgi:hypothetical protein
LVQHYLFMAYADSWFGFVFFYNMCITDHLRYETWVVFFMFIFQVLKLDFPLAVSWKSITFACGEIKLQERSPRNFKC